MATFSLYNDFTTPNGKVNIIDLGKDIKNGKYEMLINDYRAELIFGEKPKAEELKKKLPAFTPSGIFHSRRKVENLDQYSSYIHLDFDKLTKDQLHDLLTKVTECPHTALAFVSPSGDGLKIFLEVNSGPDHHALAYQQVKDYYENLTGLKADEKCKDITRLCFVSYDPDAYRNLSAKKFIVNLPDGELPITPLVPPPPKPLPPAKEIPVTDLDLDFKFNQILEFTSYKITYAEGSRNNYIYQFASNCNRRGITQIECEDFSLQKFDLSHNEIRASVRSAYTNHLAEFGKYQTLGSPSKITNQKVSKDIDTEDSEDYLKLTPTIPDDVFTHLPDILRAGCDAFDDVRQRDVFFITALSVISGCLPGISGIYGGERIYPHLFVFIIAPAASGKGVAKNAKRLADKLHDRKLSASRQAQSLYDEEIENYKNTCRNLKKTDERPRQPEKPTFKTLFIPADSSSSRMIEHLENNGGEGIICETEADTMSGAKKQDWGDYSPILRASFHHEKVTYSRKTDNQYIEIKEPKLAVCLTGTPSQAPRLISSSEDGLFSRFLFYAFKNDLIWLNPAPSSAKVVYNDHFDRLSEMLLLTSDFLSSDPSEFTLSHQQWSILNDSFSAILQNTAIFNGDDSAAVVYRLGLITFRICMIFSALRKAENAEMKSIVVCDDHDFHTALIISKTLLNHSILMFNNLPNNNGQEPFKDVTKLKMTFIEALPATFQRAQAVELGKSFNLSSRTIDDILRNGIGIYFHKLKPGHYQKN